MSRKNLKVRSTKNLYSQGSLVNSFCNGLSFRGKKSVQEKILLQSLSLISNKDLYYSLGILSACVRTVSPSIGVKGRKSSRGSFYVPYSLNLSNSSDVGVKWILNTVRRRKGRFAASNLSKEIREIQSFKGSSLEKKIRHYRLVEENKNFSNLA